MSAGRAEDGADVKLRYSSPIELGETGVCATTRDHVILQLVRKQECIRSLVNFNARTGRSIPETRCFQTDPKGLWPKPTSRAHSISYSRVTTTEDTSAENKLPGEAPIDIATIKTEHSESTYCIYTY